MFQLVVVTPSKLRTFVRPEVHSGLSKQKDPAKKSGCPREKSHFLEVVRMSPFRRALALLFFITGFCGAAWSQASFTSLRGTITDSSGAVIPGATVSIVN